MMKTQTVAASTRTLPRVRSNQPLPSPLVVSANTGGRADSDANRGSAPDSSDPAERVEVLLAPTSTDRVGSKPSSQAKLSLGNVSKIKLMAASQRRRINNRRRAKAGSLTTTEEGDESASAGDSKGVSKADPVKKVEQPPQRREIATFETTDVKWKAVIMGDLEKFMYPSLRLESLYDTNSTRHHPHAVSDHHRRPVHAQDDSTPMPTPNEVDVVMATTTKVDWEVEKRFKNSTQSVPSNGHPRIDDHEYKELQFDKQLEAAEGLLRKRDVQLLEAKRQQGFLESLATRNRGSANERMPEVNEDDILAVGRKRGASLYEPHLVNTPQLIPRLPHTRKIIKEIQRHTSTDGQINYYADKHNLFTKWKKLQLSELHKMPSRTSIDGDSDEDFDDTVQPFGALSPRSLFYHQIVKNQVLPEPIFSRINEVKSPRPSLIPATPTKSFSSVAARLIHAVHEKHTKHEDFVVTPDGRYATKKHHLALHLQHFGLGDLKMDALSKSLQHFQSIQVLDLSNNRLTDASIIQLLECLEAASPVRPSSSGALGARARRGNDLRVLNLSQNDIGVAGCTQIARFLGICTQLTHLDLSHAKIGGVDAIGPLTSAIESHRTLQVVNLSYNSISSVCAVQVGDMITQPSCSVTDLDISWNQICRDGATAIGRSLRTNTMLCKLNLAMNRFSDEGAEQLASALSVNTTLTELDLSRNNLGGRSAIAFGFYLRMNRSLRLLKLQDNHLGATGAKALLRAVTLGSPCEFQVAAHDIEDLNGQKDPIFDIMVPSILSPFILNLGESPYDFVVASELVDSAMIHGRCKLSDIVFTDDRIPKKPVATSLVLDNDRGGLAEANGRLWKLPNYGRLAVNASFSPPPMQVTSHLDEAACLGLIRIIERGFSSREIASLLALALNDVIMTTELAEIFITRLRHTGLDIVEIIGRLWPCLIDGDRGFDFLQKHLSASEQRRLIDSFGVFTIQFTTENPTGRWTLNLADRGQRKIAIWFAMINAKEAAIAAELHAKRTDSTQYGKGFNWRNASYNRKAIRLTYEFFDRLPTSGVLEFDYVSTVRHEDVGNPNELSDAQLEEILQQVGAEVCSIYIPLHKRKDLKYQLLLFHVAMANRFLTSRQAHRALQYFPKNYESCRFQILLAVHRTLIDIENLGEMLDRLVQSDRRRVYQTLGYLNVVNPLAVDMDFEIDFERDDEKMLLRALVDLSMSCPMDMIRIESERSTVLVIYSMYQTNSVPAQGHIYFRYVSHPIPSRTEFIRLRMAIFKHFLCGERLRVWAEGALASAAASALAASAQRPVTPSGAAVAAISASSASTSSPSPAVAPSATQSSSSSEVLPPSSAMLGA